MLRLRRVTGAFLTVLGEAQTVNNEEEAVGIKGERRGYRQGKMVQ